MPIALSASFTSSNLNGWIIASIFVISSVFFRLLPTYMPKSRKAAISKCRLFTVGRHARGRRRARDRVLGVSRDSVLVNVQALKFARLGDAEEAESIECGEHCYGAG